MPITITNSKTNFRTAHTYIAINTFTKQKATCFMQKETATKARNGVAYLTDL
jgi:hypothetical protein